MKIGVIGAGYWGPNLIRNLFELGVLEIICDKSEKALNKVKKLPHAYNIKLTKNVDELLQSKLDALVISTPPDTHYELAKKALLANKHIFVEKPLTLDSGEASELIELAEKRGLVLMVGHTFLYSPDIKLLRNIINDEEFGNIYYMYSRRLNLGKIQSSANVVQDLAPHDISIFQYLLGKKCESVQAYGSSYILGNVEEVVFVNLMYEGSIMVNLHLSWIDPLKVRELVVVGSKQMVKCDSLSKRINLYNKGVDIDRRSLKSKGTYAEHLLNYRYGDEVIPYIESQEPLKVEMLDFINCIENPDLIVPESDGNLGLEVVKVLEAIQKSLRNGGKWVRL